MARSLTGQPKFCPKHWKLRWGKIVTETYGAKHVADQFENARQVLEDKYQNERVDVVLPLLNVAAVAIENYLKCLAIEKIKTPVNEDDPDGPYWISGKAEGGHNLGKILDILPKDVRIQLECAFMKDTGLRLRDELRKISRPRFEAIKVTRYFYEKDMSFENAPYRTLMLLSAFLRDFVNLRSIK